VVTTVLTVAIGLPLCARYGIHGAAWTQALVGLLSAMLILFVLRTEMIRLAQRIAP
jgi:O-antigen/teichoic acid export membrane protein